MKTALLIIDVQNGFINDQTRDIPSEIAHHIKASSYDLIVFTKFINTQGSNFEKLLGWKKCYGPPESDLAKPLVPFAKHIIEKHTYSAFKSHELIKLLKNREIQKLSICGLDTDACVLATAFDAFDLGYDFEIIEELTYNMKDDKFHTAALDVIRKNLAKPR
jgi:nicotinamidase-related amidase